MARIRTIKPEFPHSESMGRVSRDARLLFIMLWTLVDDAGITRGNSRMLASLLFPYDDDAGKLISAWLNELDREGCIVQYAVEGQTYLQICNWLNHQKIDKPSQSKFPSFENIREDSRILPVGKDQGRDQGKEGKGKEEEGKGKEGAVADAPKKNARTMLAELGVEDQPAKDWLEIRKAKRAPLTQTALDDLVREAGKAGISVNEAVTICARRCWQGFNSSWDWQGKGTRSTETGNDQAREGARARLFGDPNATE